MKRLLNAFLLSVAICGCKASNRNINDFTLEKVSSVQIDESNVVLKTMPNTSILFGADHVISSIEYTRFVVYNLKTGKVEINFSIDSMMHNSRFDVMQYVRDNCEKAYPGRRYQSGIDDQGSVPFKILKFPAKVIAWDSVVAIVGIFTPYSAPFSYNGETVDAIYLDYSFALATIDFNSRKLKNIYPLKNDLLKQPGDTSQTISPYLETGTLLDGNRLLMTVQPSRYGNELVALSMDHSNALEICPAKYPKNLNDFSRSILSFNLQKDKAGDLFYNSIYDIYNVSKISTPKLVVSLQGKLNTSKKERINSFCKIDKDGFLIQTLSVDSNVGGSMNFMLYNPETKQLGKSMLNYSQTTALDYVLYTEDGFFKFTMKDENYYFEKYIIKYRSSSGN